MRNDPRKNTKFDTLLGADDPPPFTILNTATKSEVLVVCDHGGVAIPAALNRLGLDNSILERHISHDIGAASITRLLSKKLKAKGILFNYSRLVVDPNRWPDDPTLIREISDGVVIPGNRSSNSMERKARYCSLHLPYQQAIAQALEQIEETGVIPAIISIHSFTPIMKQIERPWHVGILTNVDRRIGEALMKRLSLNKGICIGDNLPYSGMSPYGYTIEMQAIPKGYPNVLIEIRQDLIDTKRGVEKWGRLIAKALVHVLEDRALFTRYGT